jgi:multidrug resistance efflux pump
MKLIGKFARKTIFSTLVFICLAFIGVGLALIGSRAGYGFLQIHSVQAFINGEIISVRASIPGELVLKSEEIKLGNQLEKGQLVGTIKSTVESSRVSVLKIDKQELETRLQDIQKQLFGVRQQIQNRTELMSLFSQLADNQRALQIDNAHQQIKQYEAEIAQFQATEKVAIADAHRFTRLAKQGAETISKAENETAKAQQASAAVKEAQAKIKQASLSLHASKVGLQLDGTRTLSYPEIRVHELIAELTDLKQQAGNLEKQFLSFQLQLTTASKELKVQQTLSVLAPITGVIWSVDTQPQEIVEANKSIIQLLNCQNLWVEAFINENDASKLFIGQATEISLDSSNSGRWKGQVETFRAGTGRFGVGQYVVEPPPEISRRQLPVRVITVRIKVDWQKTPRPEGFCLAGRSVNVHFLKKDSGH